MSQLPSPRYSPRLVKVLRLCGFIAGVAMLVIGFRFLAAPEHASRFFGVGARPQGYELYYAIGLRDLWVAGLVIAFAWTRQWTALMLWFAFAALVCFGDAALVVTHGGRPSAMTFHTVSGLLCTFIAVATYRLKRTGVLPFTHD
jgi:Domain of unknown function (DUF4267)